MGDYTLAPHLFVLIPFIHQYIKTKNSEGVVEEGDPLGSKCKGIWKPKKEDIIQTIKSLSHASKGHRDDLINLLQD